MTGRVRPRWRRDSGVYFQPFSNPYGTTRESPYRLDGRRVEGSDWRHFTARPFPTPILIRTNGGMCGPQPVGYLALRVAIAKRESVVSISKREPSRSGSQGVQATL